MKILLTERFQKDLSKRTQVERARFLETMLELPASLKNPHRHSGTGIRKLHRSGIYEARVGLGLRLVFALRDGNLILAMVGTHDQVRKYLASLK
jgi:mRNA-degrading endonuclease RelE of RelBE toxin-antitoxin system